MTLSNINIQLSVPKNGIKYEQHTNKWKYNTSDVIQCDKQLKRHYLYQGAVWSKFPLVLLFGIREDVQKRRLLTICLQSVEIVNPLQLGVWGYCEHPIGVQG